MHIPGTGVIVPLEWAVLIASAIIVAFDSFRSGTRRAVAISLAAPIAVWLGGLIPHTVLIGSLYAAATAQIQAVVLVALFAVLAVSVSRMIPWGMSSPAFPLSSAIVGVAVTVVLLSVWLQTPALAAVFPLDATTREFFALQFRFWWIAGAYVFLLFASL
jgi:hypothetical protein